MKNHTNGANKMNISILRRAMILVAVFVTAIAVAVTCAFCFGISRPIAVDEVEQGEASASLTSRGSLTGDQSAAGKLNNNDYLTYSKTGTVVSITLPIGEYKLEVWGAQGGKGTTAYDIAGKGGYTAGTLKLSTPTTIYIVVGGAGANATTTSKQTVAGGYNGGGTAKSNRTCQHAGGGGGGATHMALATGLLSSVSTTNVLIVAGGGGGAGNGSSSATYSGGGGGGAATNVTGAVAGGNAGLYGVGGNTSSGGVCTGTNPGASGSYGVGGSTTGKTNYCGGAGGGGGYYGGSGGANPSGCTAYGGGGGSSYAKSTLTSTTFQRGTRTGDGYAAITVINVNQNPVTANKTYTGISRTGGTVAVKASEIATDPDQVKTALYFTDGLTNRDTLTQTNSVTGLYLNSACTTNASKYIDWTWVPYASNTATSNQINITKVKLYPRNGVDGCTLNGRLTLYAKVRDSFGTSNTQRGYAVIVFYVQVSPNAGSKTTASFSTSNGNYIVGTSGNVSADADFSTSAIYNPNGSGRYTLLIEKPIQYDQPFTVNAAGLLSGISSYDKIVMALTSTTAITGTTRKFKIDEYDSPTTTTKPTVYNKSKVQVANTFTQLSFRCLMPDPAWQVFTVQLYVVEETTAYTEKNVSADVDPVSLDIVFKMDNNRPTLKTDTSPLVELSVMSSKNINLSDYFTDEDIPSTSRITSATHVIKAVEVPTYEYVQLDKYDNIVPATYGGKSVFNVTPTGTIEPNNFSDATGNSGTSQLTGNGLQTGFDKEYITSGTSVHAFVQYSFSNDVLTLTGLRATYDLYRAERKNNGRTITNQNTVSSTQIENLGHFYILINIQDKNDVNDKGIWLPLAITVNNATPTDTSKERGGAGASIMPTADGVIGSSYYFTPMGITVDRVTYPLGVYNNGTEYTSDKLQPLASDADNFNTNDMLYGGKLNELLQISSNLNDIYTSVTDQATAQKYFTAEYIDVYVPTSYFGARVKTSVLSSTAEYTIPYNGSNTKCYKIQGLKITLNNWTHNRYLYATVNVGDCASGSVGAQIAINVNNTTPYNAQSVALCKDTTDGKNISSQFTYSADGTPTITYNMPEKSTVIITPYDLLWDYNLDTTRPENGFTLNGLSGAFGSGEYRVGDSSTSGRNITGIASNLSNYGAAYTETLKGVLNDLKQQRTFNTLSTSNVFGSALETVKTTNVEGLFFARKTDGSNLDGYTFGASGDASAFEEPSIIGSSFISYSFGNKISFPDGNGNYLSSAAYNLDFLVITAVTRTQVAPVEIEINVRDRMGAGASGSSSGVSKIKIVINVNNSTPHVQHPDNIYTLTTLPVEGDENLTLQGTASLGTIYPSTLVIYAATSTNIEDRVNDFLIDNEEDNVEFYTGTAPTVLRYDASSGEYVDIDENGVLLIGNYVSVSITANTITITAINSTQSIEKLYIFFDVTDGKSSDGRELDHSTCKIQVQVLNAKMTPNTDTDGFIVEENAVYLWTIESATQSDQTRARYFASSSVAVDELKGNNVSSGQIKTVVKDTDGLQGAILAPVVSENPSDPANNYYLATSGNGASYKLNVPSINTSSANYHNRGIAVNAYIGDSIITSSGIGNYVSSLDILFYINEGGTYKAYRSTELRNLSDDAWLANDFYKKFYDEDGRWTVIDWAVEVIPAGPSTATDYISLDIMMRDEAIYGGDTAGLRTGYTSSASAYVDGFVQYTYKLYVNGLGIVPYTYYDQFNGYYTVADPRQDEDASYIVTYDDNNNVLGSQFGTKFDLNKNYENELSGTESAFKYSATIKVSEDKVTTTYVPMSYMALRNGLASINDTGILDYTTNTFVAYDVGYNDDPNINNYSYNRSQEGINGGLSYKDAITISDGTSDGVWTGNSLNDNPYVLITSYELGQNISDSDYTNVMTSPYFNSYLSMFTLDSEGNKISNLDKYGSASTNVKNNLLYLAGQGKSLPEHTFGIGLTKKSTRASASALTISIKVALCQNNEDNGNGDTVIAYNDATRDVNSAVVTFKIEIGNDPVTLANGTSAETGAVYDETSGYYSELHLQVGSTAGTVNLIRNDGTTIKEQKNVVNVLYNDDDKVVDANGKVDETKSDAAYFYYDSLTPITDKSLFDRITAYSAIAGSNTYVFDNVATSGAGQKSWAQIAMQNYYGSYSSATNGGFVPATTVNQISQVSTAFQPNPGIYGSNIGGGTGSEGYSSFFRVSISPDGKSLTITPNAKTTLNTDLLKKVGTDINKYYNDRGLIYKDGQGYYPLKVLIYDSHGDGVATGSYLALEIRIYVDSAKPSLSNNLENNSENQTDNAKKINIALPVGSIYQFSLSDVISSSSLLSHRDDRNEADRSTDWYWKSDYDALVSAVYVAGSNASRADMLRADTGMYLLSPFADSAWRATNNEDLIKGNGKLSDNNVLKSAQPDVIMYMNYSGGKNGSLDETSVPKDNNIQIKVNRRTTFNSKSYKNFVYTIKFTDNSNSSTDTLYIYVEVTNLAPSVRTAQSMAAAQDLRMRVGDSFTLVTTPYDRFTGAEVGKSVSDSAAASTSYQMVTNETKRQNIELRNLCKVRSDSNYSSSVQYSDLTAANVDTNEYYSLHNYNSEDVNTQHLGYLAVADDDTPWSLRIEQILIYNGSSSITYQSLDRMPVEGSTGGTAYPLDMLIIANSVCNKLPVSFVLSDGEGARVTYTMYITVESSKPSAIGKYDTDHKLSSALTATDTLGVYQTYMTAYTNNTSVYNNVEIMNGSKKETIKNVYGQFTLNINEVAYDPDSKDNNDIALFTGNGGILAADFDLFTINGLSLQKDGLRYYNDIYEINVDKTYTSFTVKCLTYNPNSDVDELKFYVRDCGNNVFNNSIPITIQISTLYSTVTNDHQASAGKVTLLPSTVINTATVDTVNIKPFDDYLGTSTKVKDLPESEKEQYMGVDSTYQFLNYKNVLPSVDQTVTDWGLNDPDILNNTYNLNYDVRVYALMDANENDYRSFESITLNKAAQLFDYDLVNHYWWIKDSEQSNVSQYFVGGVYSVGGSIDGVNNTLVEFINKYFVFEIGSDGVSLSMRPVTRNIDCKILFYVEVEKVIPTSRYIRPVTAAIKAGTLFYVDVQDSAPIVNSDSSILEFAGKINESHIFPIYDSSNPFASMFTDSDAEDIVRVDGFVASGNTTADYENALVDADCDWRSAQGKQRAIEITVNNDDIEVSDIPAHSLRVTILRRVDKLDSDGNYMNAVTFPVYIVGLDKANERDTATLMITIINSDFDVDATKLVDDARHFDSYGVGYEIIKDTTKDRSYNINVKVAPDDGAYAINLVADRWFDDPDFTSMAADTDSFRLIKPSTETDIAKYMITGPLSVYASDNSSAPSAILEPILGNNGANIDENHFVGFTVTALSYNRGETSTAYFRVIDRSGNDKADNAGVIFKVTVEVLNAAPTVKAGNDVITYIVNGSDTKTGDPIAIDVSNYIEDKNTGDEENFRIVSMLPIISDSTVINCTTVRDDTETGGNLLDVEMLDNTHMTITPRSGFYGTQDVQIVIADGDLAEDVSARTVMFTVRVTLVYDFTQVSSLNSVTAIRSIPKKVTTQMLFPDVVDTYNIIVPTTVTTPVALTSDDEVETFNPGKDYVITSITSNTVGVNLDISKDADGDWQFTCDREFEGLSFNITFVRRVDVEANVANPTVYNHTFTANVGPNHTPTLLENFKRSTGYIFKTGDGDYGLDSNGTIAITTGMLFSDVDIELGDRLLFDPQATSVVSSTICSVRISDDGTILYLTFNYRGETDLTVGVKDRTGETTTATIHIRNVDRPEASFMSMIMISVETHPYIWLGVGVGILLLILLLILLIILLKRRKRKREELEEMLVQELELEEQMLRIANTSNAMYQSFGYLPPTMTAQPDPNLMIGGGGAAPANDVMGLNPGNNGVPTDSDM